MSKSLISVGDATAAVPKNRRKRFVLAFSVFGLLILVLIYEFAGSVFGTGAGDSGGPGQSYYTSDDGTTFFADAVDKPVPYDQGGKTVVQAHVFRSGSQLKVVYLSRSTPDRLRALEEVQKRSISAKNMTSPVPSAEDKKIDDAIANGIEIKAPGGKKWVSKSTPDAAAIIQSKPPSGNSSVEEVFP